MIRYMQFTDILTLPAVTTFQETLTKANVDDQSAAFLVGRFAKTITETTIQKALLTLDDNQVKEINAITNDAEKMTYLHTAYTTTTGQPLEELANQVAQELLAEFQNAA